MRVVFLGNDAWSVPALEALASASELDVVLVVTNEPRPAGRGSKLTPTRVAAAARDLGLPLAEVRGVRAGRGGEALQDARPDVLLVVAYGEILTPQVLDLPSVGAVNLHFSLLPRWRGAAPVQHALLAGDDRTGVTTMLMDVGLDTGPILEQRAAPILPDDDAGALGDRLAAFGAELVVHTLRSFEQLVPQEQDPLLATAAPRLTPHDRVLDWHVDADAVVRRVRALAPEPGARTTVRGQPLGVLRATLAQAVGEPGEIVSVSEQGVVVAAGTGAVLLESVGPAGRRRMSAREWANGARLTAKDRFT